MGSDIYLVQAVSNGYGNSKPCCPASCEDTTSATLPNMCKAARARSTLLAALICIVVIAINHISIIIVVIIVALFVCMSVFEFRFATLVSFPALQQH